ncbi:MAG: AAA family ATPase, partial [Thermoflexus sp.]|nr:AAA family ATPase [Thermoflexus sp.]
MEAISFVLLNLLIGDALFGGNVLGAIVGGVLGSRTDSLLCSVFRRIYERLKGGGRLVNRDLERAVLLSYLEAQRIIAKDCRAQPSCSSEEKRWLDRKVKDLEERIRQAERSEYVEPPLQTFREIELLVAQPSGDEIRRHAEALRRRILNELTAEEGAPGCCRPQLEEQLFPLMAALFSHRLMRDERVRAIFQSRVLAGIDLKLEELLDSWRQIAESTRLAKEWFERLEQELAALRQEMRAGVDLLQREIRRRPIWERYAGWEVADRVEELLGEHTDLFVGREAEMARLDAWIAGNRSGRLLITAPAGFGKTALLANWVKERKGKGGFIAYHFFSRRDDKTRSVLEAYRNLLRQLFVYHELDEEGLPNEESALRDAIFGMMKERGARPDEPLVIVLDGLDEADQPFSPPFPSRLPDGVFVVASARAGEGEAPPPLQTWAEGAERLHLTRLPRAAIREYLRRVGDGKLAGFAEDDAFVARVDEKTDGFPLYLRFLADEMVRAAEEGRGVEAVLDRSPRGFGTYVQEQWRLLTRVEEMHRRREVQGLFALLSVALGPVPDEDVEALTGLNALELEGLPWQVTRWFTVRAHEESHRKGSSIVYTYAFAHPLLADEFRRVLGRQAQEKRKSLLAHCARWRERRSPYALRHYAEHLRAEGQYDDLYALARDEAFRRAQAERFPEEPDLPLRTIRAALMAAAERDDPGAMAEWMLMHARQVAALSEESPLDALRAGRLERALGLADLLEAERGALWHLLLAWELKDAGRLEEARRVLERLMGKPLPRLAFWHLECAIDLLSHLWDVSREAFNDLSRRLLSDKARRDLCMVLLQRRHLAIVREVAKGIEAEWLRDQTLLEVVRAHVGAGEFDAALRVAKEIKDGQFLAEALAAIARARADAGDREGAREVLRVALEVASGIERGWRRAGALVAIVKAQVGAGEFDAALGVAKEIEDGWRRAGALVEIVKAQVGAGEFEAALGVVKEIEGRWCRAEALVAIVKAQVGAGELDAAFGVAKEIEDGWYRVKALLEIAEAWASAGDWQRAREVWAAELEAAREIEDEGLRAMELLWIARAQADAGDWEGAQGVLEATLKVARGIKDEWLRVTTPLRIAEAWAGAGDLERAREVWGAALEAAR